MQRIGMLKLEKSKKYDFMGMVTIYQKGPYRDDRRERPPLGKYGNLCKVMAVWGIFYKLDFFKIGTKHLTSSFFAII